MDNFKLFYSVLKYIPSSIRMESINVGIVVHAPSISFSHLFKLKNTRRVASFDDEYDKDFFNMTLDSLRFDLNFPVDDDQTHMSLGYESRFKNIENDFFLSENISFLSNEFQFSPIQAMETSASSFEEDVDELKKMYLYYDRPKSQRITKAEVKRILSKSLNSYSLSNLEKKPTDIKSDFSDEPVFDFKVGDKYIKAISFDYAHKSTMATELKSALYDINKIISETPVPEIIITTNDDYNTESYNTFTEKLVEIENSAKKANIRVVPLSEFGQALNK
ncbi:hypothetical protein FC26_GL002280 [Paucilactobacillus vaccinostercus DSM 20634]|uniref:EF-hand domain-containing protein n=1 Tax=Paucilactobacillus vaccinostercus DSM 20634 TaxID=1423813 RepID=A0A0R2A2D2_9LACO|nr:DUF3037 domain-containing protein [Paucilactobacillus vaccinostercus]KRM61063.1 hypothetical protein FC26_GL002280 [Paucilactobacillus vaccinostercus DSM 20634]